MQTQHQWTERLLSAVAAAILAAATPQTEAPATAQTGVPAPPPPTSFGSDWLRGGVEPEAVYGTRRTGSADRMLATGDRTETGSTPATSAPAGPIRG
jgi:hypothetical protein